MVSGIGCGVRSLSWSGVGWDGGYGVRSGGCSDMGLSGGNGGVRVAGNG